MEKVPSGVQQIYTLLEEVIFGDNAQTDLHEAIIDDYGKRLASYGRFAVFYTLNELRKQLIKRWSDYDQVLIDDIIHIIDELEKRWTTTCAILFC